MAGRDNDVDGSLQRTGFGSAPPLQEKRLLENPRSEATLFSLFCTTVFGRKDRVEYKSLLKTVPVADDPDNGS